MERHCTIGFAGHVDHGKTTLVRHLTGIDTDRKAEEKRRGLSIEAGVAPLRLPSGRTVAVIDVPGHTDFLKNTIRGLNGVDVGVLVVAADDGVMPQTREHLEILKFFNAAKGFVVLSKTDLVDEETADIAELEITELLSGTFLHGRPVFRFTSQRPETAARIAQGIDESLSDLTVEASDAPFRMWIDQTRHIQGHGTVVSGTVASGEVCLNDEVALLPAGTVVRVRSLESHARSVSQAVEGQRIGINLHRVPLQDVRRGMCLAAPDVISSAYLLNADLRILETPPKGVKNRQKVKIYLGTSVSNAMIILMGVDRLAPGETGIVQFRLMKPAAALPRDPFVISPLNLNTVIGGGRILEAPREKYRAAKIGTVLPILSALRERDADAYVEGVFTASRDRLITARELALKTGLPHGQLERYINSKVRKGDLIYFKGHGAIRAIHLNAVKAGFKQVVETAFAQNPLKKKVALSEVAETLPLRTGETLLRLAGDSLCAEGALVRHQGGFRITDSETVLDSRHEELIACVLAFARNSGVKPFTAHAFWETAPSRFDKREIHKLLNYLFSRQKLVRLGDGRFLSLEGIEEIKRRVTAEAADKGFVTVHDSNMLFGYGRMVGTHVLDYLNRSGFTLRRDDKHYLNDGNRR